MAKERLSEVYREHHEARRGQTFVFGGDERAALLAEWVDGPGRRVLDLGCRYGALTQAYAGGNDVVGVDVDRAALEQAAALGIETVWADVEEPLPFDEASFDVVVLGELLEHLRFPESTVAEARRVLRPGGTLAGSVPNAYRLKNRVRFALGRAPENDPTHLHMYAPADVRRMLAAFDDVELRFVVGRFTRLHPRLLANVIAFRATKPR